MRVHAYDGSIGAQNAPKNHRYPATPLPEPSRVLLFSFRPEAQLRCTIAGCPSRWFVFEDKVMGSLERLGCIESSKLTGWGQHLCCLPRRRAGELGLPAEDGPSLLLARAVRPPSIRARTRRDRSKQFGFYACLLGLSPTSRRCAVLLLGAQVVSQACSLGSKLS